MKDRKELGRRRLSDVEARQVGVIVVGGEDTNNDDCHETNLCLERLEANDGCV